MQNPGGGEDGWKTNSKGNAKERYIRDRKNECGKCSAVGKYTKKISRIALIKRAFLYSDVSERLAEEEKLLIVRGLSVYFHLGVFSQ